MPNEMMTEDPNEAIAALERFVVDNDELLQLEERIGRFNIFDALSIVNVEIRHSNFLAWLLDPNESHNQGGLFLQAFLMDLLRQSTPEQRPEGLSPITLDGGELRGVEVRREWRNIDLLILCDDPRFVIAIENKIRSGEHSNQLQRYKSIIREQLGDAPRQFVFLTPEGDEPTDDDWTVYDYRSLHDCLRRVVDANRSAIGEDVLAFVEHYLRILRSRLMDDPKIDDLCRRIYQNHRQAIDLIIDRVGTPTAAALMAMENAVSDLDGWRVISRSNTRLTCIPVSWNLPAINRRKTFKPDEWLYVELRMNPTKRKCFSVVRASPTTNPDLRAAIIKRIIKDPDEFGLKTFFKNPDNIGSEWTTIGRQTVFSWTEEEFPDDSHVVDATVTHLEKRRKMLDKIPKTIQSLIR